MQLKLPANREVEELPKDVLVKLPGDAGQMSFNTSVKGNMVSVTSTVSMNQAIIPEIYYPHLREFFSLIVDKYAAPMVLKRKDIN